MSFDKDIFDKRVVLPLVGVLLALLAAGCASIPWQQVKARFTCTDYAVAWVREAQKQGIPAGWLFYEKEMTDTVTGARYTRNHAVCFVDRQDGTRFYVEPQTRRRVYLTEKERESIWVQSYLTQ